ncbi:AaceriABL143Cp [[Ashbya] aceris (nom. inval.)]|nr:AaceriABL143Cp [[Ashbya] aceris (nom. inval.)]
MSSLTKLLQEKRRESTPARNFEELEAAGDAQSVRDRQITVLGVEKPPLTHVSSSTTTITQVDSDSDSDTTPLGSKDGGRFSQAFLESSAGSAISYGNGGPFYGRERQSLLLGDGVNGVLKGSRAALPSGGGRNLPSLSSSIPYSVPNSNSTAERSNTNGAMNMSSSWMEKYGNPLPRNVSVIDSNIISSPKVDSVEPRFMISRQKLQKGSVDATPGHVVSQSSSISSQLSNLFTKSVKEPPAVNCNSNLLAANIANKENAAYGKSIPKPIRMRRGSIYSASRQNFGSCNDPFIESPSPLYDCNMSQNAHRSRHSSFADLKRFFKRSSSSGQLSESPATPPASAGSLSSQSSNHSSSITSCSYGSQLGGDTLLYNANIGTQSIPFSKRYSRTGEKLGAGAGGAVKLVRRLKDNVVFAVKEFRPKHENETKRDYIKKITSEYCIGSTLRHSNIIATIEIVYENNRILQVMEYCDYDLFAIVMSNKMSYEEICCCFKQILVGVGYLHSLGLAHRDLKLDNCVLNSQGIVKIIDFGAAVVFTYPHSGTLVEASGIVGSDPYLAPEVCIFSKYDPRPVDIWSAAIIYACMILKKFPWKIPKLKDNSFKFFCSGRDCDSLSALVTRTADPPPYDVPGDFSDGSQNRSNNPADPNNPNIGPQRLLHSLPEESHHIIGRMVSLAPACRASIEEIMEDSWIKTIDMCYVAGDNGKAISGKSHTHTQVDQSEAHIAGLERKKRAAK